MSEYHLELRRKLLVLGMNMLVLIAVTIGMYRASQAPDEFTPVFFKTFFTLFVPTLVVGWFGKRRLMAQERQSA